MQRTYLDKTRVRPASETPLQETYAAIASRPAHRAAILSHVAFGAVSANYQLKTKSALIILESALEYELLKYGRMQGKGYYPQPRWATAQRISVN